MNVKTYDLSNIEEVARRDFLKEELLSQIQETRTRVNDFAKALQEQDPFKIFEYEGSNAVEEAGKLRVLLDFYEALYLEEEPKEQPYIHLEFFNDVAKRELIRSAHRAMGRSTSPLANLMHQAYIEALGSFLNYGIAWESWFYRAQLKDERYKAHIEQKRKEAEERTRQEKKELRRKYRG